MATPSISRPIRSQMRFKNTADIVSRKIFHTVQNHFAGRKRPDCQGEMDYTVVDAVIKCILHRTKTLDPEKNFF